MKRIVFSLMVLVCLAIGQAGAQTYVIYKVVGDVTIQTGKGKVQLKAGEQLSPQAKLSIPFKGQLQLIDQASSNRYTLKNPGTGTLESMLKDTKNTVGKVTQQYMDYMLAQVKDGGKSLKMEHSDVATVTREMQRTVAKNNSSDDDFDFAEDLEKEFDDFVVEVDREFDTFRDSVNYIYAEFMKNGWKEFKSSPAIPKPKDEKVKPQVNKSIEMPKTAFLWFRSSKKDAVKLPKPKPQPTPMAQIKEEPKEEPTVSFNLYGTTFNVRFDPNNKFTLPNLEPGTLSKTWVSLSSKNYNNLIRDCMDIRFEKQLCDWAYLNMLQKAAAACVGEGNEATMLAGFIYCQSGYRMRLCRDGNRLDVLYASDYHIYDCDYFRIDGQAFYLLDKKRKIANLSICNVPYPNEQSMSLMLNAEQKLDYEAGNKRNIVSERDRSLKVDVAVNKHLIEFYNNYPSSMINDNYMTRWSMYANTPLDEHVKEQLYPVLREKIKGMSKVEAVNKLLNFIQTSFKYEYDDDVWGGDRVFFAEESLFYPSCDCEDRAILLSRLVRDLTGQKVVLVHYPGHLAMAVNFGDEQPNGTYYMLDDERYYVCDPTILGAGAPVGMPMNVFADCKDVNLILLDN